MKMACFSLQEQHDITFLYLTGDTLINMQQKCSGLMDVKNVCSWVGKFKKGWQS
jgi:hypothetical protein